MSNDIELVQKDTEIIKWEPNLDQHKWLDTAIELMSDNISEISKECGIERKQWYRWIKKDEFRGWWKSEWDKIIKSEGWKLDVVGMKMAKRDHKYWQDMMKRVGNLSDKPNNTVPVQINNFVKTEKDEFGI